MRGNKLFGDSVSTETWSWPRKESHPHCGTWRRFSSVLGPPIAGHQPSDRTMTQNSWRHPTRAESRTSSSILFCGCEGKWCWDGAHAFWPIQRWQPLAVSCPFRHIRFDWLRISWIFLADVKSASVLIVWKQHRLTSIQPYWQITGPFCWKPVLELVVDPCRSLTAVGGYQRFWPVESRRFWKPEDQLQYFWGL